MRGATPMASQIPTRPATFAVGDHKLVLTKVMEGRWSVAVDGRLLEVTRETEAEAWEAGVREALRLDQGAPAGAR